MIICNLVDIVAQSTTLFFRIINFELMIDLSIVITHHLYNNDDTINHLPLHILLELAYRIMYDFTLHLLSFNFACTYLIEP